MPQATPTTSSTPNSLSELGLIFLRLGTVAFGGPAAHLAMMRSEFVERRRWLTESEFLDLIGVSNLIPGPGSTEVAIMIGQRRAGVAGLILAGVCFILPAFVIVSALAAVYVRYGHFPQAVSIANGIKPVVVAIVCHALWTMSKNAINDRSKLVIAGLGVLLCCFKASPLLVLFVSGLTLTIGRGCRKSYKIDKQTVRRLLGTVGILSVMPFLFTSLQPDRSANANPASLLQVFLKIGSIVYGSGYVLLAFLKSELITRLHWLSSGQLLDSVAVGQFTPGPVFTTATFIGYILAGPAGAVSATVAIFIPAFIFVAISREFISTLRRSPIAAGFLDGVNIGSVVLMGFVTFQLGQAALTNWMAWSIAVASLIILMRSKINSAWLILAGGMLGWARLSLDP